MNSTANPAATESPSTTTAISIAEVRRRLTVGTLIHCRYLGPKATPDSIRRVVRQSTGTMVSEYTEGEKIGTRVYCDWPGCTASVDAAGVITIAKDLIGSFVQFTPQIQAGLMRPLSS